MLLFLQNLIPIRYQPLIRQFIKFCLVGLTNLVFDFSVYFFLTRFLHLYFVLANVFSFTVAVTWSFWLNKHWTFKNHLKDYQRQYLRFFITNILGMIWQTSLLYLLVTVAGWHDLVAKALAVVLVAFWNFGLSRWWAFGS